MDIWVLASSNIASVTQAVIGGITARLHPRGGCGKELSLQDTLKARVAADFGRR